MQSDSTAIALRDLVTLIRGNTYKSVLLGQPGPVLLGLASIQRDGGFRGDSLKTYGGESAEKLLLRPGDVYVSLKDVTQSGDLLGAVAKVPVSLPLGRLTQDTVKLQFDPAKYPRDLLYWTLRSPEYRSYCRERAIGTTNLSLSRDDFLAFQLPEPTAPRLELVALLEAIEQRIQLLRYTNTTLESIAQGMFKSWFIDFDPVHAKAEGREPESMDATTAELFPAEFEESRLGLIPKGWQVDEVGRTAECVGGGTPSTKEMAYWEPAVHQWATPKDLSGIGSPVLFATERQLSDTGLAKISSGLLPIGTLLMSSRAPIGYLAIAQMPVAINQGFIAMKPGGVLPPEFLYFWCHSNMDSIKQKANGSTVMEISKSAFRPIPIALPPAEIVTCFVDFARSIFDRIKHAEKQRKRLADIRDALLPRLISGKLNLPEGQERVEVACT